jgi:putative ABC transport system substrate-binding protein
VDRDKTKDMKRKIIVLGLCVLLFALCVSADAQQPGRIHRIGYLVSSDRATEFTRAEALRRALRELGYIEGKNITIEYRYAEGEVDRFSTLAFELVRSKVDIIVVAGGYRVVQAAKNATKTIPIVMTGGGIDPVMAGLVESLARPGGNITGLSSLSSELGGKRLELLKESVPKLARVAVLYDPTTGPVSEAKEILPVAARPLGVTVRPWEVHSADDFERVFASLSKDRPDGLYVITAGPVIRLNVKRITSFALKSRLPSLYGNREPVMNAGGLMYYGADPADSHRRAAIFIDKLLKGAKPADLPVEQPTKFELVINLKTAKQIGVTIPPNVLARADRVIK